MAAVLPGAVMPPCPAQLTLLRLCHPSPHIQTPGPGWSQVAQAAEILTTPPGLRACALTLGRIQRGALWWRKLHTPQVRTLPPLTPAHRFILISGDWTLARSHPCRIAWRAAGQAAPCTSTTASRTGMAHPTTHTPGTIDGTRFAAFLRPPLPGGHSITCAVPPHNPEARVAGPNCTRLPMRQGLRKACNLLP